MSTFTTSCQPIRITQGRPNIIPMAWQAPDGTAIDITGFGITGVLRWPGTDDRAVTVAVTSAAQGQFSASWAGTLVSDLPPGLGAELAITIVDGAGAYHDFALPIDGVVP